MIDNTENTNTIAKIQVYNTLFALTKILESSEEFFKKSTQANDNISIGILTDKIVKSSGDTIKFNPFVAIASNDAFIPNIDFKSLKES